jgi:hypothetical protein
MKNLLCLVIILVAALTAGAQPADKMNYQAVARNSSGAILANTNVCLLFKITDGNAGPLLYSENFNLVTNQFGLFTAAIGSTNPSGFANIPWRTSAPWLDVQMDVNCTSVFTDMGSTQLLSVPYAMVADKSMDNLWAANAGNIVSADTTAKVGIGTLTPSFKLDVYSGTAAEALRINSTTSTTFNIQSNGTDKVGIKTFNNKTYFTNYQGEDFVFQDSIGSEVMRIKKSSHSVGIGTTNPLQKLEVNGAIRILDATSGVAGSIRYHNNDFEGYTPVGWESFINQKNQSLLNYGVSFTTRNALVYSNDSLVVTDPGIYLITFNVRGTDGQVYNVPAADYDQSGIAGVYKVGSGAIGPQASIFEWTSDIGATGSYYRYVSQQSSVTTIQYLVAGDVLKAYAFVQATGNPTGNYTLNLYQIQIIKIGNL